MTAANDLVVIKTQRGYATPLADAIDDAALADIAGTIAGENTIFVAGRDGIAGRELEELLRHHLET
jgi:transcriptional regulator of arginine metabolism